MESQYLTPEHFPKKKTSLQVYNHNHRSPILVSLQDTRQPVKKKSSYQQVIQQLPTLSRGISETFLKDTKNQQSQEVPIQDPQFSSPLIQNTPFPQTKIKDLHNNFSPINKPQQNHPKTWTMRRQNLLTNYGRSPSQKTQAVTLPEIPELFNSASHNDKIRKLQPGQEIFGLTKLKSSSSLMTSLSPSKLSHKRLEPIKIKSIKSKENDINFKNFREVLNLKKQSRDIQNEIKVIKSRKEEVEDLLQLQLEKELQDKASSCRTRRKTMMLACKVFLAKKLQSEIQNQYGVDSSDEDSGSHRTKLDDPCEHKYEAGPYKLTHRELPVSVVRTLEQCKQVQENLNAFYNSSNKRQIKRAKGALAENMKNKEKVLQGLQMRNQFENPKTEQLFEFCKNGQFVSALKFLIRHPDTIKETDRFGNTPLHWAAKRGYIEIVELLIYYGVDVNAKDFLGRTAKDLATSANQMPVVSMIKQKLRGTFMVEEWKYKDIIIEANLNNLNDDI